MPKPPELLESVQWTGDNLSEIDRFVGVGCTAAANVLRVPGASAAHASTGLFVPLRGRLVRVDGELRVLLPRAHSDDATSPDVERFADHNAFEDGFD